MIAAAVVVFVAKLGEAVFVYKPSLFRWLPHQQIISGNFAYAS